MVKIYEVGEVYSDRKTPVPSYEEYKRLVSNSDESSRKTLQLEERLKDAETALMFYDGKDFHYEVDGVVMGAEPAHKYFVKWGVK